MRNQEAFNAEDTKFRQILGKDITLILYIYSDTLQTTAVQQE